MAGRRALFLLALALLPVGACQARGPEQRALLPVAQAQALRRLPHDPTAFTEGLFVDGGQLYESTGQVGRSSIRRVDLESGRVLAAVNLPAPLFGEGIAPWEGQILGLTWRDGLGVRLSSKDLGLQGRFSYAGEGWGLTTDGSDRAHRLVMSDGSATLRFVNAADFSLHHTLEVTAQGVPLTMINELEWVDGEILANIWLTDRIARIDPATGHVKGWIDVGALHRQTGAVGQDQVANGIAWDAAGRHLYITGKEWPSLFEIAWPPAASAKGRMQAKPRPSSRSNARTLSR